MKKQEFGAGIWHFATYLDRYATDGYGEPRSVLDAIELAGQVKDLSYVDLNFPYFGGSYSNEQIKDCLLYTSPSPRDKRQSRMPSSA